MRQPGMPRQLAHETHTTGRVLFWRQQLDKFRHFQPMDVPPTTRHCSVSGRWRANKDPQPPSNPVRHFAANLAHALFMANHLPTHDYIASRRRYMVVIRYSRRCIHYTRLASHERTSMATAATLCHALCKTYHLILLLLLQSPCTLRVISLSAAI